MQGVGGGHQGVEVRGEGGGQAWEWRQMQRVTEGDEEVGERESSVVDGGVEIFGRVVKGRSKAE